MKRFLTICFLFLVFVSCFGNAGVFRGSGQTPTLEKTDQIQMVEEEIIMIPRRGNYPVDTSCRNLDKMEFRCRFILRNLTDQKVVIPVGFPLNTEARLQDDKGNFNQSHLIGHYGFTAGTKDRTFPVRFVPWDRKKKFSKLFLWEMTFLPKQEVELFVNYTMEGYLADSIKVKGALPENLVGRQNGLTWDAAAGATGYIVEYSTDNFAHVVRINTTRNSLDAFQLPAGDFQWRVRSNNNDEWVTGEKIVSGPPTATPQKIVSNADGNMDVFFGSANAVWEKGYLAEYQGNAGVVETIELKGRNKIADVFAGSDDANVLVLTDDGNGDALFVDDVFTALGEQARLSQIDEIRAGAGNDIIDLTSHQFAYNGDGVQIYGGLGDDVIWADNGSNILFGDAGTDRIVGGADNDVIVGGCGNDSLHGGGGEDIFCFGGDWGNDIVEQLSNGKVTLWFEANTGSWDEKTLTYTDGKNSVTVNGVSEVTLKFGTDDTLPAGVFDNFASEKIFEDKDKGLLA